MSATGRKRYQHRTTSGELWAAPLIALLSSCVGQVGTGPGSSGGTGQPPGNGSGGNGSGGSSVNPPGGSGGSIGSGGSGGSVTSSGGSGGASMPIDCSAPQLEGSPLRRLTRREYNNIVGVLLGDTTHPGDQFVPESMQSGFLNGVESTLLSSAIVDDFEQAATTLAKNATAASRLKDFVGCDPAATAGQDACATTFIKAFGARAFRRPLDDGQVTDYQALYTSRKPTDGFAVAIELIVRTMLQSPYFLYRLEFGLPNPNGAPLVRLTPDETATRLALLFWGSLPDATLTQAVKDGKLSSTADVRAQAMRMLTDDRGDAVFGDFHVQWGQLEGLPNLTKPAPFTPDIGRLLIEETKQFVSQTLRKGDGLFTTLLTSPVTYLNKDLATYYGVSGVTGSGFVAAMLPVGKRAGLLTQGSIMANFAHGGEPSQVLRGKFILSQLACSPPNPPPDNVNTNLPAPDLTKTARQQLVELTGQGTCAGCHSLMNPMGFALDNFDGLGRYRTMDRGTALDTSADIVLPSDMKGHYAGADDFLSALANSKTVRTCVASKWFIYAHGRIPGSEDACSLSQAATSFQSDGNIREMLLRMIETPAFLYFRTQGAAP